MENLLAGYFPSPIKNTEIFISSSHELLCEFANHLSGLISTLPIYHHTLDWNGEIALYDEERAITNTAGLNQCQFFSNDERHFIPSKWSNLQSGLFLLD